MGIKVFNPRPVKTSEYKFSYFKFTRYLNNKKKKKNSKKD